MHIQSYRQSCKRLHSESYSLYKTSQQVSKKQKVNPPRCSQSPSAFWDNLSKVWLTRNALRELDRRNNRQEQRGLHHGLIREPLTRSGLEKEEDWLVYQPTTDFLHHCSPQHLKDIQRYARLGGPDLSEIRGVCFQQMSQAQANCFSTENLLNFCFPV